MKTPSNDKALRFLMVLFASTTASSSAHKLATDELPPLAIKRVIHKNDDPHEQSEKKDIYGNAVKPRIVGGTDVERGEYPFFVRIDHNFFPSCGGSLVAPDVVLTAGHCLPENKTVTAIVNGYHDNTEINSDQHPRMVAEMIRHPDYDSQRFYNDVMLILLEEPVFDVPYVKINKDPNQPQVGETVTAMGLGALEETGGFPDLLQSVDLSIVDFNLCNLMYTSVGVGPLLEDAMVCAGSMTNLPQDSCQGDSGGPLLNQDGVQVGVISFGLGCAREGVPGVYCRTAVLGDTSNWVIDTLCDLTQTNDLDEWCGKSTALSLGVQEEPSRTTPMPSLPVIMAQSTPSETPAASQPTSSPTKDESQEGKQQTVTDTTDDPVTTEATNLSGVDLCIDESDATFQLLDRERNCEWLRCAHEAIRQYACIEGSEPWNLCRTTCGRCPDSQQ